MRDRRLLVAGITLVAVSLGGMALTAGVSAGGWWGAHHDLMWGRVPAVQGPPEIEDAPEVSVTAFEFGFDPARIEVEAGTPVNLTLRNEGAIFHDLTVPDLGIRVEARPGESVTIGLTSLPAGEYRFLCSVPGHEPAGMTGVLVVADPST